MDLINSLLPWITHPIFSSLILGTALFLVFKNTNSKGYDFWIESVLVCFSVRICVNLVAIAILPIVAFFFQDQILSRSFNPWLLSSLVWVVGSITAVKYASQNSFKALISRLKKRDKPNHD